MKLNFRKLNSVASWAVFAVAFVLFYSTMAPTLSFWDCGEYITAAHTVGINHPPGNPLYVLVARIFTLVFTGFDQIAARVNFLSVVSGAFTAFFLYRMVSLVVIQLVGDTDTWWKRQIVISSSLVASFFGVFNYTFWFSAVEASAYIPSMLTLVIGLYLAVKWSCSRSRDRERYLLLAVYVIFLGIGFHFFSVLALPPIFLFVIIADETKRRDLRLWLAVGVLGSVAYSTSMFMFAAPLLFGVLALQRFAPRLVSPVLSLFLSGAALVYIFGMAGFSPIALAPFALVFFLSLFDGFKGDSHAAAQSRDFVFYMTLSALVGFSPFLSIPVRSELNPALDARHTALVNQEGEVSTKAFRKYLDRTGYLSGESMFSRMVHRRGALSSQFGFNGRMGYGGFHLTQFFHFGKSINFDRSDKKLLNSMLHGSMAKRLLHMFLYGLPTLMMFWGIFYWYRRDRAKTVLLASLFIFSSVGMVLFLNFSDGTRMSKKNYLSWQEAMQAEINDGSAAKIRKPFPVPAEVRIRDYYYTAAFVALAIWVGLALAALLNILGSSQGKLPRRICFIGVWAALLLPALPVLSNYTEIDREGDWFAYDFACNLINSCDENAILIVGGDNQVYPLWFIQNVEGIRKDVQVVCFSYLNSQWYVDKMIDALSLREVLAGKKLTSGKNIIKEKRQVTLPKSGISVTLPTMTEKKKILAQDQLLLYIVDENFGKRPVYFSLLVQEKVLMGLAPYMQIEGLLYRFSGKPVVKKTLVNLDKTLYLLNKLYRYRSLTKPISMQTDMERKITRFYTLPFIFAAETFRHESNLLSQEIFRLAKQLKKVPPEASGSIKKSLAILDKRRRDALVSALSVMEMSTRAVPVALGNRAFYHELLLYAGDIEGAKRNVAAALSMDPANKGFQKLKRELDRMELRKKAPASSLVE